jgi:hypothetical protein
MWIIGDGGSPDRAPDNTIASFRLAVSEWADGIVAPVRRTSDGLFALARPESVDVSDAIRTVSEMSESEWTSLVLTDPRTGRKYSPTPFSELLFWLSQTPIRAFFEPLGPLSESGENLESLAKTVAAGRPKRPASYILPPGAPSGPISPESAWTYFSAPEALPDPAARKGIQAIVPVSFEPLDATSGFARVILREQIGTPTQGPRPHGLWGVITRTPYFARQRYILPSPGHRA